MRNTIKTITLLTFLINASVSLASREDSTESYEYGHAAMMSKDWQNAIGAFEKAGKERKLKAAASYWQAFSHYKLKQNVQAKRLLERLIKNHPESEWVDDAEVLLFEHGDRDESRVHQEALDEELKLFTLQQIMFNNPDKALPKIKAILRDSHSESVKQSAIQMLSLSDSEQVTDYLFNFIETEKNRGLKHQAVQMLSLRNSPKSREKLKKLYENSQDKELKSAIIQGFVHHTDNRQLIAMLKQESDPELNRRMIRILGIQGESAALKDMYKKSHGENRKAILEALALSGDANYLRYVIDNEVEPEIRHQAIQSLVMVDDGNMDDYLARLYKNAQSDSEKEVIASVFVATDVDTDVIVDVLKSEQSFKLKQRLINTLMAMDEVTVLKDIYLSEENAEIKNTIIRHLGALDATDVLKEMYKNDSSLAHNDTFFQAFGMSLSSASLNEDFLIARFKEGNRNVKHSVLNAFMMQGNSDVMVKLLKMEQDHDVKKQIIKMISITNPDALINAIED